MKEVWRQIPGYEGLYEISSFCRIKSKVGWDGKKYIQRDKIIAPFKQRCANGFKLVVKLTKNKKRTDFKVAQLFAVAFGHNSDYQEYIEYKGRK